MNASSMASRLVSTGHSEHDERQKKEDDSLPTQELTTAGTQSLTAKEKRMHASEHKLTQVSSDNVVNMPCDEQVKHDDKEIGNNIPNKEIGANEMKCEDVVSDSYLIPLDNISDTKDKVDSLCNVVSEGNTGNNEGTKEIHAESVDSKIIEDVLSLVEGSETLHVKELPKKSGLEETGDENTASDILLSSSIQDNAVPSLNMEQPQQLCDVELPQSNDDDIAPLVANDSSPPTSDNADSQAPPVVANDQRFNIPVPPSPPPIQAPPPRPPPPKEKSPQPTQAPPPRPPPPKEKSPSPSSKEAEPEALSPQQDPERGKLLSDIRSGAELKHVPWPKEKKAGEVEVTNVESELRHILQKRRKKEVTDMTEKLEANKEQIENLIKDIMEATKHAQRVMFLKMLQEQITRFLQASQLSLEVLDKRCLAWPTEQVSALSEILDFMDKLEVRVQNVEKLCHNSTINPDAVQRCVFEVVKFVKECNTSNTTTRFSLASSAVQVSQTDIDALTLRASRALVPLLDKLYDKAFISYRAATDGSTNKFDWKFRLTNAQRLLKMCCSITDSVTLHLDIRRHIQYSEAQLKVQELQTTFNKLSQACEESAVEVSTVLKATEIPRNPDSLPRKTKEDYATLQKLVKCIPTASLDELDAMLHEVNAELYRINEMQLIRAAISSKKVKTVKSMACAKERFDWDNNLKHAHDYDWLCEAVTMGFPGCLEVLVQQCGVYVNAQSIERAQTALHIAARKPDYTAILQLLRLGADPLLANSEHRTPLQLIAIKHFSRASSTATTEVKEFLFDLSEYLCNSNLSDVTLVSKDGRKFPAHRLVLCAQSGYFKALLGSDLWQEGTGKEVSLGTVDGAILQIMLEYLYTGKCLFPRDDLNKALELLATAEMFLLKPMSTQCETVLSEKLNTDVVVPVYQTAFFHVPKGKLHSNCCHYILMHYKDIEDPDHQILNQILENKINST